MGKKLVRFDWAMKKMLRHKVNFDILEGFLSELLGNEVTIKQILESESNKETEDDKFNRVDILVENQKGELIIIEVQSTQEHDYFHRMLFGASKAIAEHIKEGQAYANIKKVISITIAYFDLGQGKDYIYHGTNIFRGIHKGDILGLSDTQMKAYKKSNVYEIYPEYWVIKIGKFTNKINNTLDEWVYFLKNAEIKNTFTAKGLKEANEKLDEMKLTEKDRKAYNAYLNHLHSIASRNHTIEIDTKEIIEKTKKETQEITRAETREETQIESVIGFYEIGVSKENIAKALKIPLENVVKILDKHKDKG